MGKSRRKFRKAQPTTATDQPTPPPLSHRSRNDAAHPPSPPAESRDWAALPHDVLCVILSRVPQADILRGAGLACASWRRAAVHEPQIWRQIDLKGSRNRKSARAGWRAMARAAMDQSAGQCESFRGRVDADFLLYLAHRSPSLRSLRITRWSNYMPDEEGRGELFARVAEKLPLLEELVLPGGGVFGKQELTALLDRCPRLRLLDAGRCTASRAIGKRFVERCESRIAELRMPRFGGGCCACCTARAQRYADEHDE